MPMWGDFIILLLAIIYVVFISLGLPDSLFGVSWPVVHLEFGVPESFASLYSIITGACTGGVSFVAGRLIRKLGTGRVTFFSLLLTAAGLIGISFSTNIVVMMFFSIVLGYGAGAIDTGLNNYVSLHYKAQHMNWLHCFWGVGVTLSPMVMSAFLDSGTGSWRFGYRVIAAAEAAVAVLVLFSLGLWKNGKGKNTAESADSVKPQEKSIKQLFSISGVRTSIFSLGLYCGMEFLVGTWGATYLVNIYALAPGTAAKFVSLYYGGIMLSRFISGFISMKLSTDTIIRSGIAVAFSGMIFLALPLGKLSFAGLLLIGLGFGPVFPGVLHCVPKRFGSEYSADITGYHMGGAYVVGFAIQLSFGYLASGTTFFITPFVLMAICAGLFTANEKALRLVRRRLALQNDTPSDVPSQISSD